VSEGELAHEAELENEKTSKDRDYTPGQMRGGSILGHSVKRVEDPRFLSGEAQYTEDLPAEHALHAVFVRSTMAHARLTGIDTSEASGMPGVAGVFAAADLDLAVNEPEGGAPEVFSRPILATDTVRFVGEPLAVVLAETRAQAVDAAEAVLVDYDPLPVVVHPLAALEDGAPLLYPEQGSNVAVAHDYPRDEGALEDAEVVVSARFINQRVAPVPMEPNGILAIPDTETGGLTAWVPCQAPFWVKRDLVGRLGLEKGKVRVIAPAVGGGFGAKVGTYPEQFVVAALAVRLGRPVRYIETRSENMVAMTHGRAQVQDVQLGAKRDGTITGLKLRVVQDVGAYPQGGAFLPELTRMMASGVYAIPRADVEDVCVVTNTTPLDAYRGAGRPEAAAMIERAVDMLADELGMDRVDVRRKNLIPPFDRTYETVTEAKYDVGNYELALDAALEGADYAALRADQAERRSRGDRRQLGIGVSVYVEVTGFGKEFGSVEVHEDGSATIRTGTSPHGQGHETAFAQLASGVLRIPFDKITVLHSDTSLLPRGDGTMGSRSLQLGGSAIHRAGEEVVEKARLVAAHMLEASPADVELTEDGTFAIAGAPERSVDWPQIATTAADASSLPEGVEPGLAAQNLFDAGGTSFPFGAHVAVVEVDVETGDARLVRFVAVDDCGRILNPMLAEGQVHGGLTQGAAQALYEGVEYDDQGNPLTGTLMSYGMPSAAELISWETIHTQTPTFLNPLGAKGIGESGTIGSTPAVQSAVVDAVSHLGVRHIDMPLTPERVWRAIHAAQDGQATPPA
jgi:aerobic carbon-monoxide dehydrogenase large subunit